MPRKKPFSSKQKKKQLQDKRRRKQDYGHNVQSDSNDEGSAEEEKDTGTDPGAAGKVSVQKVNQQPRFKAGRYDPNRYRLHFFAESKDVLNKRKEQSMQPFQYLPEDCLEVDIDKSEIDIPKRPQWDYNLTKHKLEENEVKYFQGYVEDLFEKYEPENLSYFELNLETWRQLWRVFEMSDMFLLITDIRHPTLHFPPALYRYVTEKLQKHIILVLNKVDLAPPSLVVAWQHYFKQHFPLVEIVCFTSYPKTKEELEKVTAQVGKTVFKRRRRGTYRALGPRELYDVCVSLVKDGVNLSSWGSKIDEDQGISYRGDSEEEEEGEEVVETSQATADLSFQQHERYKDGILTIGCIGYPNVGKSSVINGLMGKKVVSVSKTPGHTKHFQTIFLTPTVKLCDCPGLIFPSKAEKYSQILGGIYPIAQVREPYSTIEYLARRMNLPQLLKIRPVDEDGGPQASGYRWSAFNICESWAKRRGFQTAQAARLDVYRAANNLLRMAVTGQICLCTRPRGYTQTKVEWERHPDTDKFINLQHQYRQKDQASCESDQDAASSSSDPEQKQAGQHPRSSGEVEEAENTHKTQTTVTNMFALLGEEDD